MILVHAVIFFVALAFLLKGSEYFVRGAANIAENLGISKFIVGLTVVAIGTSVPELASAIVAAFKHESGIIIGNAIGSNIANIGLIVGIGAALAVVKTKEDMFKRDGYMMIFATIIFLLFILDQHISRVEAGALLIIYGAYIVFLLETRKLVLDRHPFVEFVDYFVRLRFIKGFHNTFFVRLREKMEKKEHSAPILKYAGMMLISGAAVVLGANYVVDEAIFFAHIFNVPTTIISISLIALGTSLPELAVTLTAIKQGVGSIGVGNILGSNIANILMVVGVGGIIYPLTVIKSTLYLSAPFMLFLSLLFLLFIKTDWEISRKEGVTFLFLYVVFMGFLFALA